MKKKKKPSTRSRANQRHSPSASTTVALQKVAGGGAWTLVHPRCARDRAEDIEEVRLMIEMKETEVARDELQWLLSGCSDSIDAHYLLGLIAVDAAGDWQLARAHFGYAYQLGLRAWQRAGSPTPVPYSLPANRGFHESGSALARCLHKLGKSSIAAEVVQTLGQLDPQDPLGVGKWWEEASGGGLPILGS